MTTCRITGIYSFLTSLKQAAGGLAINIKLKFWGAAQTVTGSCMYFDTGTVRFIVDCGMFQGAKTLKELNYRTFPFPPARLDFVLLTHAHIDHSGLIPKLVKAGFNGPVYATPSAVDLCSFMLVDSGHIQEMEVENLNRRNNHRGRPSVTPIYTAQEAEAAIEAFEKKELKEWFSPAPGIKVRFWNAGHILGSASIEVEIENDDKPIRLLFSGDLGPDANLLQPDPEAPQGFDYVFCESTYGDTVRKPIDEALRRSHFADVINEAKKSGGALLIPAFAVERTQELLMDLAILAHEGKIDQAPIFLDSPLAIRATKVFGDHSEDLNQAAIFNEAVRSKQLHLTESADESRSIEKVHGFHIIIAASGMCDAGRIRHHLKNWLWNAKATVLFVGFQAQGTLGRILLEGARSVRIMGEEIKVHAQIKTMEGYSGHADAAELVRWIEARQPVRKGIFLDHGEVDSLAGLERRLKALPGFSTPILVPDLDDEFEIERGDVCVTCQEGKRRIEPKQAGALDWHNAYSSLLLDMNERIDHEPDDRKRATLIRRLRDALVS